jgi:hypothetical protein
MHFHEHSRRLLACIAELADAIASRRSIEEPLAAYVATIGGVPARCVLTVEAEVRSFWDLYLDTRRGTLGDLLPFTAIVRRPSELLIQASEPRLATLYIFHHSGWLRQEALNVWPGAPANPLEFAAIAQRLNDWVPEVRRAALHCAERHFPQTAATVIAAAAPFLFERANHRQRWSDEERAVLDAALYRVDVLELLVDWFKRPSQGRVGAVLRQAMRRPGIDAALPRIAREAGPPTIRAIALEALVLGRARWLTGYGYQWVDKRYGIRRRVPEFAERSIARDDTLVTDWLSVGASDRAPAVRRVAARLLPQLSDAATPTHDRIAYQLAADKVSSVSAIANFYLRERAKA